MTHVLPAPKPCSASFARTIWHSSLCSPQQAPLPFTHSGKSTCSPARRAAALCRVLRPPTPHPLATGTTLR